MEIQRLVAVLGYGNQGRAQALNLRDSGVNVIVGLRPGPSWDKAVVDGFQPLPMKEAADRAELVSLLMPDQAVAQVYNSLNVDWSSKILAFAHGFVVHFGWITLAKEQRYFLVGSKGAGAVLRSRYEEGSGLPGVYAVSDPSLRELCLAYAKAIGIIGSPLETTFKEEVECDLFGEQVVLCGGLPQLMEAAYETLVSAGYSQEMAFYECCFEAQVILELWMKRGPSGMAKGISPTAFYGGLTRGRRLIDEELKQRLKQMLSEIQSGLFAEEFRKAIATGNQEVENELARLRASTLEKTFETVIRSLQEVQAHATDESRHPSK